MNERMEQILEAIEKKLGNLTKYESQLIVEADMLKNMYETVAVQVKKSEELLKQFSKERSWFESFESNLKRIIEDELNYILENLLNKYNINLTLIKGESND